MSAAVATILLAWALVEDWEVGGGWMGHQRTLKGPSGGGLPFAEQGGTYCRWHHGLDFPDCPDGKCG